MAGPGTRTDPYLGFRFRLEIKGIQVAGFQSASVPDETVASVNYREGTDGFTRKLSGQTDVGTMSLKRGITDSMELYNCWKSVSETGAAGARKSVSVILIDETGQEKVRWDVSNAWPTKYSASEFSASGSDVMVETLDLELETVVRVK
jgi:phage tail-like protein